VLVGLACREWSDKPALQISCITFLLGLGQGDFCFYLLVLYVLPEDRFPKEDAWAGFVIFAAFLLYPLLGIISVFGGMLNISFWKFCQGKAPANLVLSSLVLIFTLFYLQFVFVGVEKRKALAWKVVGTIGVLGYVCWMVMAGVFYGHMRGDYIYVPQEGIEIRCLRAPKDDEEIQEVGEWLSSAVDKVAVLLAKKKKGITSESVEDLIWTLTIGMRAWTLATGVMLAIFDVSLWAYFIRCCT
jgi:hypothetical protein